MVESLFVKEEYRKQGVGKKMIQMLEKWAKETFSNYTVEMATDYITNILSENYCKKDFYDWGIVDKNTNALVGRITVFKYDDYRRMADLVWYMMPTFRCRGLMTEAGKAVVEFLQNIGFERIEAFANIENIASIRVMEKLGMEYEGTLRSYDCRRNKTLYDAKMYSIIK